MEPSGIFIIIPAFNENAVLRSTVSGVIPFGYTVVVVDDGSAIPAASHLEGLNVYCLRHAVNLGQGAALQTGGEFALTRGAEVIVHFDADGQHSPELIDADDRRMVPRRKRILLKTGAFVSWVFTGVWLTDAHNGFRALSCTAAGKIQLKENGFAHATEILDLLRRAKLSFKEVPVAIRYTSYSRAKGQSMFNSFNIVIDLMLRKLFK
jgi:glycosyltransferase involved in cell wall biosynthesis